MVSVMLYPCILCVALLMYLFDLCGVFDSVCELFGVNVICKWYGDGAC